MALAAAVGKPVRVDMNTLSLHHGRYARVCVEIEVCKPAVMKVWFKGQETDVLYEGVHMICEHCHCFGHLGRHCSAMQEPVVATATTPKIHTNPTRREEEVAAGKKPATIMETAEGQGRDEGWTKVKGKKSNLKIQKSGNQSGVNVRKKNGGNHGIVFKQFKQNQDSDIPFMENQTSSSTVNASHILVNARGSPTTTTPLKRRRGQGGATIPTVPPVSSATGKKIPPRRHDSSDVRGTTAKEPAVVRSLFLGPYPTAESSMSSQFDFQEKVMEEGELAPDDMVITTCMEGEANAPVQVEPDQPPAEVLQDQQGPARQGC